MKLHTSGEVANKGFDLISSQDGVGKKIPSVKRASLESFTFAGPLAILGKSDRAVAGLSKTC